MRKEVELIKRCHVVQKKIFESNKELRKIQSECRHEVVTDSFDFKGKHTSKCLFCGKILDSDEVMYMIHLNFLDTVLSISNEGKYWLLQQLFFIVAEANPGMSNKEIVEKVLEKIKKRDDDFFNLQWRAYFGRHD